MEREKWREKKTCDEEERWGTLDLAGGLARLIGSESFGGRGYELEEVLGRLDGSASDACNEEGARALLHPTEQGVADGVCCTHRSQARGSGRSSGELRVEATVALVMWG